MSVGNQLAQQCFKHPVPSLPLVGRQVSISSAESEQKSASANAVHDRQDPLYMFYCGLQWHEHADSSAGWELIEALRSWDRGVRGVAAALLAKTEHARLLVRDLRRTRSGLYRIATEYAMEKAGQDRFKGGDNEYSVRARDERKLCFLQVAKEPLVLRPFFRGVATFQYGKPSQHVSRECSPFCRRPDAEGCLRSVFGKGEALHDLPRRQSADRKNGRGGRGVGLERGYFRDLL